MSPSPEILETRRAEALAFFDVNQRGRTAAERVIALIFSVSSIVASVGVAAKTDRVVLPLPALLFLLLSYMFQQYGDLTVVGAARRRLEDLVNAEIGGKGLVYETAVAEIRQVKPLVLSVRVLQGLMGATVGGATIFACWVLSQGEAALVVIAFTVVTSLTMLSAGLSYRDMLRSYDAAGESVSQTRAWRRALSLDPRGPARPGTRYEDCRRARSGSYRPPDRGRSAKPAISPPPTAACVCCVTSPIAACAA